MFRHSQKPKIAREQFRQAAEKFLQSVDFTEDEQPWALVLLNTMGAMIEENDHQHHPAMQDILVKKILEDLEYIVTSGKYEDNTDCAEFAQAIRAYVGHLKQLRTPESDSEAKLRV